MMFKICYEESSDWKAEPWGVEPSSASQGTSLPSPLSEPSGLLLDLSLLMLGRCRASGAPHFLLRTSTCTLGTQDGRRHLAFGCLRRPSVCLSVPFISEQSICGSLQVPVGFWSCSFCSVFQKVASVPTQSLASAFSSLYVYRDHSLIELIAFVSLLEHLVLQACLPSKN